MSRPATLDDISGSLAEKRVIYAGETHDNYAHHLTQLELIKRIHQAHPDLAIGMEMFQRPFQQILDAFIEGSLDEREFLRKSEWFERWRYDYRLYRPILQYALTNRIPLVALNASAEIRKRVSAVGFDGLTAEERSQIPGDIDRSDTTYTERLRSVFSQHMGSGKRSFDHFLDVQLLWDETMAETAALYLKSNPGRKLVVLAGSGHLKYGAGIPQRVARRVAVESAIVLPATGLMIEPGIADYLLFPQMQALPKAGLIGVYMEEAENGVLVAGLSTNGAAAAAGVEGGDILIELNGQRVTAPSDIRLELLGRSPGERIQMKVIRKQLLWGEKTLDFAFDLGE